MESESPKSESKADDKDAFLQIVPPSVQDVDNEFGDFNDFDEFGEFNETQTLESHDNDNDNNNNNEHNGPSHDDPGAGESYNKTRYFDYIESNVLQEQNFAIFNKTNRNVSRPEPFKIYLKSL
jgi:hypothetical protein